ncbi:MAG: hypothetical protein EOO41_02265 [Methanobacteriota archaeon]|nr:MAG: hypothetical protein EOO41_02265 [Euryarchaeota archaeon]
MGGLLEQRASAARLSRPASGARFVTGAGAAEDAVGVRSDAPLLADFTRRFALYTQVSVGTPPQLFNVAVDIASSALMLVCKACATPGCQAHARAYDPSASLTAAATPCANTSFCTSCALDADKCLFSTASEDSHFARGQFFTDAAGLFSGRMSVDPGTRAPLAQIACIQDASASFLPDSRVEGVLGFSHAHMGMLPHLVSAGVLDSLSFTVCLSADGDAGGRLILGAPTTLFDTGACSSAPLHIQAQRGAYQISLTGFQWVAASGEGGSVQTTGVPSAGELLVLDTGAPFSFLPPDTHDALLNTLRAAAEAMNLPLVPELSLPNEYQLCVTADTREHMVASVFSALPTLALRFAAANDAVWALPPSAYMLFQSVQQGAPEMACFGMFSNDRSAGQSALGAHAWRGLRVTVDVHATRVTWCAAACTRSSAALDSAPSHANASSSSNRSGGGGGGASSPGATNNLSAGGFVGLFAYGLLLGVAAAIAAASSLALIRRWYANRHTSAHGAYAAVSSSASATEMVPMSTRVSSEQRDENEPTPQPLTASPTADATRIDVHPPV